MYNNSPTCSIIGYLCVFLPVSTIMVQRQLCTLEHLMNSGFGRPFPRHGLQLLFWFANHCVTCELINFVLIIKVRALNQIRSQTKFIEMLLLVIGNTYGIFFLF